MARTAVRNRHHPRRRPAGVPVGFVGLVGLVLATAALTGCSSSAPATLVTSSPADPSPGPSEDLLTEAPGPDTATGQLAAGFPTALVPVPEGAEILVSSAQSQDDGSLEISLNLRTAQDTAGLLDAVRAPLLAAGFGEVPAAQPDPGLAAQTTFSRSDGAELVLVGILDRDDVRTLTLGGRVRP